MTLLEDVRYAFRVLRKSPAYTLTAVAALAPGIGANTAIFNVFNALLLRSLPYGNHATIVAVWEDVSHAGFPRNTPAAGNYNDWRTKVPAFQDVAAADTYDANLSGEGEPEKPWRGDSGRMPIPLASASSGAASRTPDRGSPSSTWCATST
jgi:putative ABC transport system permease protein